MRITTASVATGGLAATLWIGLPQTAAGQPSRPEDAAPPARGQETRLFAQAQQQPATPQAALAPLGPEFDQSADRTRNQLEELFQRYPPGLRSVLRLDPSLLNNRDYLTPYPALAAFLAQHPEVAHNPSYLVGTPSQIGSGSRNEDPSVGRLRVVGDIVMGFFVFLGVVAMIGVVGWTIKMIVDHRRWLRSWKVQNEAHGKLIDRLASNDELLAYLQSPVAKRLLEATPPAAQQPGAPLGRILFSVQVGTVAALLGLGFLLMSRYIYSFGELAEMAPVLVMFGSLLLAGGIGFIISAGASYYLSKQLGLLSPVNNTHA
jgi:hypothetical protein